MTGLPGVLALTDRSQLPAGRSLAGQVGAAVAGGLRAVVLRERDLPPDARRALAEELRAALAPCAGLLLSASPYVPGTDGVHLRRDDARARDGVLTGRSCHGAGELQRAADDRLDYVTLSPVAPSASKPGYGPSLGADGLRALLARAPAAPPAYALGGVTPADVEAYRAAGAHGVAVMGPLMRAADPAAVAAALRPA